MGITHNKSESFTCRSYKGLNRSALLKDIQEVDWSFLDETDIEPVWKKWKEATTKILDKHTRMINIKSKQKNSQKPWIDQKTLGKIRIKQAAAIRKHYMPTAENISNYNKLKRETNMETDVAKQRYYQAKIEDNVKNPRKLWAIMKHHLP